MSEALALSDLLVSKKNTAKPAVVALFWVPICILESVANKIQFEHSSKYVLSEFKQFLISNWVLLCKITIHTILFKRPFRYDLKQRFSKWRHVQKLLLTGKLKVYVICHGL